MHALLLSTAVALHDIALLVVLCDSFPWPCPCHLPAALPASRLAPDAASVAGLLHLRKLPSLGTAAPPAPEAALHLVRHKRRRLAITAVEICPGGAGQGLRGRVDAVGCVAVWLQGGQRLSRGGWCLIL